MFSVNVDRKELLKAIQIVEKAVTENKIREVLSGIYMETFNNKIILKGTDLEVSINTEMDGEILEEGKVVIKHKIIEEFLKQINDEKVELTENNGMLLIKTENTETEFSLYDASNYPIQNTFDMGVEYKFNKNKILKYIENMKISASKDPGQLAVNCIRIEIEENMLKLVSSDTYRLTYVEEALEDSQRNKESISVSIPLKTIDGLIGIMKIIDEEEFTFKSDGTKVFFKFSNIEILSRVIELQFPDYKSILKNVQYDKKVLLNTKDFISVLKRTRIFVRDNKDSKNGGVFEFKNNKLTLRGLSDNAKIKEELSTIQEGDEIKISLNVEFLLEYISILEGNVTEMKLLSSKNSVLVKDEANDNSLFLTMPLALRE